MYLNLRVCPGGGYFSFYCKGVGLMVSILSLPLPIVTCVHSVTMLKYSLVDASIFGTDVTVRVCV